jgi:RNA-directed DNA polymerase
MPRNPWRGAPLQAPREAMQLTGRSWGVSMEYRYTELRRYVVGWLNYFALSEYDRHGWWKCRKRRSGFRYYRPIPELDEWLRRRLRTCYWKQWRWARTKVRQLIRLGINVRDAIKAGMSSKGPYCMSRTKVTQMAMTNDWLKQQGLVSIKDHWVRCHYDRHGRRKCWLYRSSLPAPASTA